MDEIYYQVILQGYLQKNGTFFLAYPICISRQLSGSSFFMGENYFSSCAGEEEKPITRTARPI